MARRAVTLLLLGWLGWKHQPPPAIQRVAPDTSEAALRRAIDRAVPGDTIWLPPGSIHIRHRILIQGKRDLTILGQGQGKTVIRLASDAEQGFAIASDVHGLTIARLSFRGTPPFGTTWAIATANYEQNDITQVVLRDMTFDSLANGIFVGAGVPDGKGRHTYDQVLIENNVFRVMVGNDRGSGYGVNNDGGTNVTIIHNRFEHPGRHAIYQSRSHGWAGTLIEDNLVIGHGPNTHPRAGAIAMARSVGVTVANNVIVGTRRGLPALTMEFDPPADFDVYQGQTSRDLTAIGNRFVGSDSLDLYVTERGPHRFWGNQGSHRRILCEYQLHGLGPGGPCPDSLLMTPSSWEGTQVMTSVAGRLYVLQQDSLREVVPQYLVDPEQWQPRRTMPRSWHSTGLQAVAGLGGFVYVLEGEVLYKVQPSTWSIAARVNVNRSHLQGMSAAANALFLMGAGTLYRVNPVTLRTEATSSGWEGFQGMAGWGDNLYLAIGSCNYELNRAMDRHLLGCAE